MTCPSCGRRKSRRACPALGQLICSVCCGSKRLVEIACPSTCHYLATAREHPPGVVLRQQKQDVARLLPVLHSLDEPQQGAFFLLNSAILRHEPEGFARLSDDDVAAAATAVAATLETAARGIIYEHVPQSTVARKLAGEIKELLRQIREEGISIGDADAAEVLRAIAKGAEQMRGAAEGGATAYLTLIRRLLAAASESTAHESEPDAARSIILP